ncbi:hypothetical protein [Streptomyces sp. DG1A-41]|uniref:hypothetical protein n=1 Tax=Streptomyces sp. DG1A-41 TaxID=3125779 RepID=UPI0030CFE7AC
MTEVLKELALEDSVTVVNAHFKELDDRLPADLRPIDFAWVDAWECIAECQRKHPGELEVLNLLESHKLMQNSITILSRTSSRTKRRYAKLGGEIDSGTELHAAARRQAGIR